MLRRKTQKAPARRGTSARSAARPIAEHAATALRLELPCPQCSRRHTLAGHRYESNVAVLCLACGNAWAESITLHVALAKASQAVDEDNARPSHRVRAQDSHEADIATVGSTS